MGGVPNKLCNEESGHCYNRWLVCPSVCSGYGDRSAGSISLCLTEQHRTYWPQNHGDNANIYSGYVHHKPNKLPALPEPRGYRLYTPLKTFHSVHTVSMWRVIVIFISTGWSWKASSAPGVSCGKRICAIPGSVSPLSLKKKKKIQVLCVLHKYCGDIIWTLQKVYNKSVYRKINHYICCFIV